jgi:hypothetical protein
MNDYCDSCDSVEETGRRQPDQAGPVSPPEAAPAAEITSTRADVILGTGAHALALLSTLDREHPKEVAEAAEMESPGLSRRAERGDRAAVEQLADVFGFTQAGRQAMVQLGEEDLDAGRWQLAELRFHTAFEHSDNAAAKADALWRLAVAQARLPFGGKLDEAGRSIDQLAALAASQPDLTLRLGGRETTATDVLALVRKELARAMRSAAAVKGHVAVGTTWQPIQAGSGLSANNSAPPASQPAGTLAARMIFSYHPSLFDLKIRFRFWPMFWGRSEPTATVDGPAAYFHDAANLWAVDWAHSKLLWHYRSPGEPYEVSQQPRGFANHVSEIEQSPRHYGLAACPTRTGTVLAGRFRRALTVDGETGGGAMVFDLRALAAADGRLLWTTQANPDLAGLSFACDPVAAYDRLYALVFEPIQISTAYLVCLDPATGRVLFKSQVASRPTAGSPPPTGESTFPPTAAVSWR